MLKRTLDVCIAGLLLVVLLPILIVAGILIRLDSRGPVVYTQVRVGRGFRRFRLLKLRTMYSASEGLEFTFGRDPRITRVGRWLRWLKFDELPQLWNVLIGDMSLVGPRPVVPQLTEEFRGSYERLLVVRPGLTDPATVKYCRESEMLAQISEPMWFFKVVLTPDKLNISLDYLDRATLWSDLRVMLQTAYALLSFPHNRSPIRPVRATPATRSPVLTFPAAPPQPAFPISLRSAAGSRTNLLPIELACHSTRIGSACEVLEMNRR